MIVPEIFLKNVVPSAQGRIRITELCILLPAIAIALYFHHLNPNTKVVGITEESTSH